SHTDELTALLPPGSTPGDGEPDAEFVLTRDGAISIDGTVVLEPNGDRPSTLRRLGSTMRHHLAWKAPNHVFIHAGVVSVDGNAVVVPGASCTGKSTLVAALVQGGERRPLAPDAHEQRRGGACAAAEHGRCTGAPA